MKIFHKALNAKTEKAIKIGAVVIAAMVILRLIFAFLPYKEFDAFISRACSTRVYDSKNNLIQIIPLENGLRREYLDYKEIPSKVVKAFIHEEDSRYYLHPGIDVAAIIRAAFQNASSGHTVSGASTITMQVAKIIRSAYSNTNNDYRPDVSRSLTDKFWDCFDALKLEARLSKKQILELYLNTIPFGRNTEGVSSASRCYFGTELKNLSDSDVKLLAKIPRNPKMYGPVPLQEYEYPYYMPHLVNYLRENDFFGKGSKKTRTYKGPVPYQVHLSVNLDIQFFVRGQALKAIEKAYNSRINNISVLVLDVQTGNALAWLGSQDWYESQKNGQIDGVRYRNQPGSSIKPLLYALALENGIVKPTEILADVPHEYGEQELYVPLNFNNRYNGPVKLRVALASSLNVPAVDILARTGIETFADKLDELGFKAIKENAQRTGYGLALGGGEVSLQEFVPAFSVLARDGIYKDIGYFADDADRKGRRIYSSDTVRIIDSILSDKSARSLGFGLRQTFITEYPSIFKTGTSNQFQNITALGATPRYAVGVWMGNFSGETVMGKTGSSLPAQVAKTILDYLEEFDGLESLEFCEPEGYEKKAVCALSGMYPGDACSNTVYEYVKKGEELEVCSWHKIVDGETIIRYPAIYQEWLLDNQNMFNQDFQELDYSDSELKITSPQNNALFYFNPYSKIEQIVNINVIGGQTDDLEVYYDDRHFQSLQRPFYIKIPVEPGVHKVRVECGHESSEILYTVQ
ncbi:MAG: transglycosylase domain-containing protein [Treponema sp.]|nr:transglycosylase domain-containing protein [Treponema sp.]